MQKHYSEIRKIDPARDARLGDGTPNLNDRLEIGPTLLAIREWEQRGLQQPNLDRMRKHRLDRLTKYLSERDLAAALLFDPLNIRYATDTTNMQVWNSHNPFRAALVCADGYLAIWDYMGTRFLSDYNDLISDRFIGASMFYFASGDLGEEDAENFRAQITETVKAHAGSNKRIAIDKIMPRGLMAFKNAGMDIVDGEELMEKVRSIKGEDEILAMRCAVAACEKAVGEMVDHIQPGLSENEIWSHLHAGNIKRGGEWIETRLLASGPRTNPWFQECGPRIVQNNEIVAFDTDLISCYGMCVDISRTVWVGDDAPRQDMRDAMAHAKEHLDHNIARLKPGMSFHQVCLGGHTLFDKYQKQKYGSQMHGVGLCDEWPSIPYPDEWRKGSLHGSLQPGMTFSVESLVSPENGDFSIKLEDQVLITQDGVENLTCFEFDAALLVQ